MYLKLLRFILCIFNFEDEEMHCCRELHIARGQINKHVMWIIKLSLNLCMSKEPIVDSLCVFEATYP